MTILSRALLLSSAALLASATGTLADGMPGKRPAPSALDMTCSPTSIRTGSTLSIEFPARKGATFAVVLPDGNYRFISFAQPDSTAPSQPVIGSSEFEAMTRFVTSAGELQGILWTRTGKLGPVFQAPGRYRFVVAETLETEDPILDGYCEVDFR